MINHADAAKRLIVPLDMAARRPVVALTREVLVLWWKHGWSRVKVNGVEKVETARKGRLLEVRL